MVSWLCKWDEKMKLKFAPTLALALIVAMSATAPAHAGKLKNAKKVYEIVRDSAAYDLAKEAAKRLLAGTKCKGRGNSGTANSTPQTC